MLGAIWVLFLPHFFMKGGHPGGLTPMLFLLGLLPFSVLLTRTFDAAAGSVLLPHLLHQSINSWAEVLPFLPRFTHSLVPLAIGVAIVIALAAIVAVVRPSMWRKLPVPR